MTIEELEKALKEAFDHHEKTNGGPIGEVYPGLFHIGDHCYTNAVGWEMFNKSLEDETKNYDKDDRNNNTTT